MTDTRKINLVTRVEGHGSLHLVHREGKVVDGRFQLHESPRLFEALLKGKRYDEVADIACRICSICSTVHKVAALMATEQALGVQVSRQTGLLRQLAVQGGMIESHALHIFCLALPDHHGVNGFPGLAEVAPHKLKLGLEIKALGNQIQETVGGRAIHPFNLLPGGMGRAPERSALEQLADRLSALHDDVAGVVYYVAGLPPLLPELPLLPACAVSGGPPLFGDRLITSTGATIPAQQALAWFNEQVQADTNAKVSRFSDHPHCLVGPMARCTLYARSAGKSLNEALLARAIELQQSLVQARELIATLISDGIVNEARPTIVPRSGEGVAIVEAPRGVLLHRYCFDQQGICTAAEIVTPTAINQAAMQSSLTALIARMPDATEEQITIAAERLIRCFDPCISCAVH